MILASVLCVAGGAGADARDARQGDRPRNVTATLAARSEMPTLKEIAPYRDALVVYEYQDSDGKQLRVAHWAIRDGVVQGVADRKVGREYGMKLRPLKTFRSLAALKRSDTLEEDLDATMYFQVDQPLTLPKLSRGEYGHGLTPRMRTLHTLRGQIELLAWGDSRTDQGIDVSLMMGQDGSATVPRAYNLSVTSSGVKTLAWLVDHYVPHLPKLKWLVVGLAPRMVSCSWEGSQLRRITNSPAWREDLKTNFADWQKPTSGVITLRQLRESKPLKWDDCLWGGHKGKKGKMSMKHARRQVKHKERNPRWRLDVIAWLRLKRVLTTLDRRGVNVLVFTPPTHPAFGESKVISEDGISREGHREFIDRLAALEKTLGRLHVIDTNRGGKHNSPAEVFADLDHLNPTGRERLSRFLESRRRKLKARRSAPAPAEPDPDGQVEISRTTSGLEWAELTKGAKMYVDRDYKVRSVGEGLRGASMLRTRNDDKTAPADKTLVEFHVDRPARIWLGVRSDPDSLPDWLAGWDLSNETLSTDQGEFVLIWRNVPRGPVRLPGLGKSSRDNYVAVVRPLSKK
jgi:hypothetical protein